jgi:hypothetical protein
VSPVLRVVDRRPLDPRPCQWCGLGTDRHTMIDQGEGPELFCLDLDDMTLPELERRAELIRLIETAEIFARLEAMAEPAVRRSAPGEQPRPYRTPEATVQAFWYVVRLDDADRLDRWLGDHPADAAHLLKLLQARLAASLPAKDHADAD